MPSREVGYGQWSSPISAKLVAETASVPLSIAVSGKALLITEARPEEQGRVALLRYDLGAPDPLVEEADGEGWSFRCEELLSAAHSVRSRVYEMGGAALCTQGDLLCFVNDSDQALYLGQCDGQRMRRMSAITAHAHRRFAEPQLDVLRERVIAIEESHDPGHRAPPLHRIVAIGYGGCAGRSHVLCRGQDFYASPQISPSGMQMAWLSWRHPHMPWDETSLWVADLDAEGLPVRARRVAGGDGESVAQPRWDESGQLHFLSDRTGFWNLYRHEAEGPAPLCPRRADFCRPQWRLGQSSYCFLPEGDILCTFTEAGTWHLARLNSGGELTIFRQPLTEFDQLVSAPGGAALICGSPTQPLRVARFDSGTAALLSPRGVPLGPHGEGLDPPTRSRQPLPKELFSRPAALRFPTADGAEAHALFYPPNNPEFAGSKGQLPPVLVRCHGGPTEQARSFLSLATQYWTTRGFAVVAVNYRGSSGYGRAYRARLEGRWGVADVEDCEAAVRYLASRGFVDGQRAVISGGSAGGFTTLCALTFGRTFAAGAVYFGISDLERLAAETHKFESHYLDTLIGPYPQCRNVYRARSPLHHRASVTCPIAFFHGLQDRITPPNQAREMVRALKERGVPVAYLEFPEEGHGFRQAETVRRTLDAEYSFYCMRFGLDPLSPPEPIAVEGGPMPVLVASPASEAAS